MKDEAFTVNGLVNTLCLGLMVPESIAKTAVDDVLIHEIAAVILKDMTQKEMMELVVNGLPPYDDKIANGYLGALFEQDRMNKDNQTDTLFENLRVHCKKVHQKHLSGGLRA